MQKPGLGKPPALWPLLPPLKTLEGEQIRDGSLHSAQIPAAATDWVCLRSLGVSSGRAASPFSFGSAYMGSKPTTLVAFQQRSLLKLFEVRFAANVEIRAFIFMRFHPSPPLFPPPLPPPPSLYFLRKENSSFAKGKTKNRLSSQRAVGAR